MPLVGCIIPTCPELHVFNSDVNSVEIFRSPKTEYSRKLSNVPNVINKILNDLQLRFDVLVIIDAAHRDIDNAIVHTMAHGYAHEVYIIPSLMARFMAVFDELGINLHKIWSFGMITHAAGCDVHIIRSFARGGSKYNVVNEFFYQPGIIVQPKTFPNKPELLAYVTFEEGHPGVPEHDEFGVPLPPGVPFERVCFRDLISMLYQGGIAKARQIMGYNRLPEIENFTDTIAVTKDREVFHMFKVGQRLPAVNYFRKGLDRKSTITIRTGMQLIVEPLYFKRVNYRLFRCNYSTDSVEIKICVDKFGLISISDVSKQSPLQIEAPIPLLALPCVQPPSTETQTADLTKMPAKNPWVFENVVGHVLLSNKLILHASDGTPMEETIDGIDDISNEPNLNPQIVTAHTEAIFLHRPLSLPCLSILCHDGTLPASLVLEAVYAAAIYFPDAFVHVVDKTTAFVRNALRQADWLSFKDFKTIFLAIANGSTCQYMLVEDGWTIIPFGQFTFKSTGELIEGLSNAIEYHSSATMARLFLTETAPLSLQQQLIKLSMRILRVKSFETGHVEGVLDIADALIQKKVPLHRLNNNSVYFKQKDDNEQVLHLNGSQNTFVKTVTVDAALGGFKIYQRISTFSAVEFVLYECESVPIDCTSVKVNGYFSPLTVPRITVDLPKKDDDSTVPSAMSTDCLISNSDSESELVNETKMLTLQKENAETMRWQQLKNMDADICITLDAASSTARIELVGDQALELILDPHGHERIPFFVSLTDQSPRIGFAAMYDFRRHPDHVVWDLLKILGRSLDEIEVDPKWTFELFTNVDSVDSVSIVFESTYGRISTEPTWITAMFLRGILNFILEKNIEKPLNRMFFRLPPMAPPKMSAMIKDACNKAGIVYVGSNLLE